MRRPIFLEEPMSDNQRTNPNDDSRYAHDEAVKFIDTTTFKWRENPIILGVLANLYGKLAAMYQIQSLIQKEINELERKLDLDDEQK